MKVNQIIGEHKKGVRAMKYAKKTKSTVPVYGPEANDAKLKPVKPVGTVKEDNVSATIKAIDDKHAEIETPMGVMNLDRTKPEGAAALMVNPETKEPILDLTPDVNAAPQQGEANPLSTGAKLTVKTDEAGNDIGGDATDDYINDVTDHDFEQSQGVEQPAEEGMLDAIMGPSSNPQIDQLKAMLADPKYASNPAFKAQLEKRLKIAQDRHDLGKGMAADKSGQPAKVLPPDQYTGDLREADNALLNKMLTIAGLR